MKLLATAATAMFAVLTLGQAFAASPEDTIRQTLNERIPQLTKIDEVRTTPMQGLYEVRVGTDVFYTDAQGNYLIQGELIDTQARRNLTEDRIKALTAVKFSDLPLNDAIKVVQGKGERQIAVFADPNCGYCKRFERDMQSVDNVTMHVFLIPILSPDSVEKSRNIWCAKDSAKSFEDWMVNDITPAAAKCDAAPIARNVAFGKKAKITGTPTVFFADGTRVPGAIPADRIEQLLSSSKP